MTRVATTHDEHYASTWGVGRLTLAGDLPVAHRLPEPARQPPGGRPQASSWADLLVRYFAGERVRFDLDIDAYACTVGLTAFERDVFRALARVPYGRPVSYAELALLADRPGAQRAVGSAMARNQLPVILPCHRVIRSDGTPGPYGDDPGMKVRLLALEGWPAGEGAAS